MAKCHDNRKLRLRRRRREEKRLAVKALLRGYNIFYNGVYLGWSAQPPKVEKIRQPEYEQWILTVGPHSNP